MILRWSARRRRRRRRRRLQFLRFFLFVFVFLFACEECSCGGAAPGIDWSQWWTYDGISGPRFWGVINPEWVMCREGRRQSPIDIDPETLLFDPNLTPFSVDQPKVRGELMNTGHGVEWRVSTEWAVNITGGPLSYVYTVSDVRVHFGDEDTHGSEHTLDGFSFPAEVQLFGFNSQLYRNFSEAAAGVNGIVGVAVLVKLEDSSEVSPSPELSVLLKELPHIKFGGSRSNSYSLSVRALVPSSEQYMTYEGSLTEPGCQETVTWVLPNKPLYINSSMLKMLRSLRQGEAAPLSNAPIANNFRPTQERRHRTIRTNVVPRSRPPSLSSQGEDGGGGCVWPSAEGRKRLSYKGGSWLQS